MLYTLLITTVFTAYPVPGGPIPVQTQIPVESLELCEQAKTAYLAEPMPPLVIKNAGKSITTSRQAICLRTADQNGGGEDTNGHGNGYGHY